MSKVMTNLLAVDDFARAHGCGGLNPRLRAAMVADLRFPARAASPHPSGPVEVEDLPDNALPFPLEQPKGRRRA